MRHRRKPVRTFESLENRSMLAGNVTAAVDGGGNLTITGDAKANTIYIAETSSGGWRIQGLSTKINGHAKIFVTAPVTGNITVDMGDGNDRFSCKTEPLPATFRFGSARQKHRGLVGFGHCIAALRLGRSERSPVDRQHRGLRSGVVDRHASREGHGHDQSLYRSRFANQPGGRKRFADAEKHAWCRADRRRS